MPTRRSLGCRKRRRDWYSFCFWGYKFVLRGSEWAGYWLAGFGPIPPGCSPESVRIKEPYDVPKKPTKTDLSQATKAGEPGKTLAKFPTLASYLVDLVYSDDPETRREPSTLILSYRNGDLHCYLTDPSNSVQVHVVTPTFEELFATLEGLLKSEDVPWVYKKPYKPRKGP